MQMRREFGFTAGRIIVRGKFAVPGQHKHADYRMTLILGKDLWLKPLKS